jgi:hypothetical protein
MSAPTSEGVRGMGFQDRGRALWGRTGSEFIEAPIFNNLILIKKADLKVLSKRISWINEQSGDVNEIRELSFMSKD